MDSQQRKKKAHLEKYLWLGGIFLFVLSPLLTIGCRERESDGRDSRAARMVESHFPDRFDKIGPHACRECHAAEYEAWRGSHHDEANRPIRFDRDRYRFSPERVVIDGETRSRVFQSPTGLFIEVDEADGTTTKARLEGVLAYDPLQQYLAAFTEGKWQVTSIAYDPAKDEWFEVFPGDERMPGHWGHWTGRGMNWNANCAYCHMTEYEKNYDHELDIYHSRWLNHGIACAQCHTGLEEHVRTASLDNGGVLPAPLNTRQQMDSCYTCHTHRDQLTADEFRPGDRYHDHFSLSLPDQPGLYYPDGQVREEVFVGGSFQMSSMGHKGVTCMDCHDPHSLELTQPVYNNMVCLQCHADGRDGAQIIEPLAHSHHPAGSSGNLCVECHMPHTVYMERDPRRDHGFLSPDPLMTRELGIPNACSRCHEEEGLDWVIEHAESWYGDRLAESEQRKRARILHALYEGADDEETGYTLLAMAKSADNPTWRATYTGLLAPFLYLPEVRHWVEKSTQDPSHLVRVRATRVLSYMDQQDDLLKLLLDESRSVRIEASRMLSMPAEVHSALGQEWEDYLHFNSDRVQGALLLAEHARKNGQNDLARNYIERSIQLDRLTPEIYNEAAILMSRLGDEAEAARILQRGLRIEPAHPRLLYSLALLRAGEGQLDESIRLLTQVVREDPEFHRAWLNLSIALSQQQRWREAWVALRRAEPGLGHTGEWQNLRSYLQQNMP